MIESQRKPISVLLVDDHLVVRAGLRMIIQSQPGMTIAGEAGTCGEALAIAADTEPDIVLLDLDLGEDNGMEIISELLAAEASPKVIILTGSRDPKAHKEAVMLGAMGLVPKAKAAKVLIKAIESVHSGDAWLDPSTMAGVLKQVSGSKKSKQANPEAEKISTLTNREREVVTLVGEGLKNKEIADRLFISDITVRHHLTSIFSKLGLSDRVELMIYAYRHDLASPPQ